MTDYEFIGRVFVFLGSFWMVLMMALGLLKLAWVVFKEVVGWPRIFVALKLLRDSEQGEKP